MSATVLPEERDAARAVVDLPPLSVGSGPLDGVPGAWRWPAGCFAVTFLIYVALVPQVLRYSSPPTGDQPSYLMITQSLVQDGDLNVRNNYENREYDVLYSRAPRPPDFVGISAPYPLPPHLIGTPARPADEQYSFHMPGLPLVLVPAWVVGGWLSLWWPATIVVLCIIGALVTTNVFLLARDVSGHPGIGLAVWAPLAFSNPIMSYSFLVFTELPTSLLVIYAFRRLALGWTANGPRRRLLIGGCIGYLPWMSWRCVAIAAALALMAAIGWWGGRRVRTATDGRAEATPERPATASIGSPVPIAVPILLSAVGLVTYALFLYGKPLPDAKVPELGDRYPFHWPWMGADQLVRFVTNGFGLLFDSRMGLFVHSPIYLLSAVGMIAMLRGYRPSQRRLLAWIALVCAPYAAVIAAYELWNGVWNPPARFQAVLVPLMAAPLSASFSALSRSFAYRALYGVLALLGVAMMASMLLDARRLWPAFAAARWPDPAALPFGLDVWNSLPAFEPLDDVGLPIETAWVTVVSLAIVLACDLLALQHFGVGGRRRLTIRGLAWSAAIIAVVAGWYLMSYQHLKPITELVEQRRWTLEPAFERTHGLAYSRGKLYLASGSPTAVGELDVAGEAGVPQGPRPLGAQQPQVLPGDVKVGSDGLLYVLNLRDGSPALVAMEVDGRRVRALSLNGRSSVTSGLALDGADNLYVGDTVGGRILKYGADGGDPVAAWGGATGRFNNVFGLAIADDGTLYAAELSNRRVQHLDQDGRFLRVYDLPCEPRYVARWGDWLDITCGERIMSIHTRHHDVRRTRLNRGSRTLEAPHGLAHGPDGTLYVVDRGVVVAYSVLR